MTNRDILLRCFFQPVSWSESSSYRKTWNYKKHISLTNDWFMCCNNVKVSSTSYHYITPTPLTLFKWQTGPKNWQQRAAWSNVIWLVAKCVIVASIRARRKSKLSVDASPMGGLMNLQYYAWNESLLFAFWPCSDFSNLGCFLNGGFFRGSELFSLIFL